MNSIRIAILLVIPVLMFPVLASAQSKSIYSWTDENGVKHFSDRAPANVEASQQEIVTPPADRAGDSENPSDSPEEGENPSDTANNEPLTETAEITPDSTAESNASEELSYADQQRKEMAERREAEQQKRAEREQVCLKARDQLARIEPSRRVFETDEDGNTTRMDDEERVRLVEENKKQIAEFCD